MAASKDWRQLSLQPFEAHFSNSQQQHIDLFMQRKPFVQGCHTMKVIPPPLFPPGASFLSLWNLSNENLGPEKGHFQIGLDKKN